MKTNIITKHKWLILAVLLMVALMALSISYSAWDTLSVNAMLGSINGNFTEELKIVDDKDGNNILSVGDIVQFGRFYQSADAINTHETDPLRWIVVDYNSNTKVASILTEKVVIFGNYWGDVANEQSYKVNYYHSTARSWLNSGKGSLRGSGTTWKDVERYTDNVRNDGVGSSFGVNQPNQVNKGFLDVAFSDTEKSKIIPKKIEDMQTVFPNEPERTVSTTTDGRTFVNDLVWILSQSEIFGENYPAAWVLHEGTPKQQMSYFVGTTHNLPNQIVSCGSTDYAMNADKTSYYNNGKGTTGGTTNAAVWATRSPDYIPQDHNDILGIGQAGAYQAYYSCESFIGLRPGVCVQL